MKEQMIGWLIFGGFIAAWIGLGVYGIKRGQSKIVSFGGGFIGSLVLLLAAAIPFAPDDEQSSAGQPAPVNAAPVSKLSFDSATIASFFAAGSAMVYCERLSDAQALTVGDTAKYMGQRGSLSVDELRSTVNFAAQIVSEDLRANGGCSGSSFREYERNYYEFIKDPAISHLQIVSGSPARRPDVSPLEQIARQLEGSSNPVCRNYANVLRSSNPGAEDSILSAAEKYGCL